MADAVIVGDMTGKPCENSVVPVGSAKAVGISARTTANDEKRSMRRTRVGLLFLARVLC